MKSSLVVEFAEETTPVLVPAAALLAVLLEPAMTALSRTIPKGLNPPWHCELLCEM